MNDPTLNLTIAFDVEDDGRVIASVPELPHVLPVYGKDRTEARRRIIGATLFHLASELELDVDQAPPAAVMFAA